MDSLVSIKNMFNGQTWATKVWAYDVDNLYGVYHFLEEAKAAGLQPTSLEMKFIKMEILSI